MLDGKKVMAPAVFRKALAHRKEIVIRLSMSNPAVFCQDGTFVSDAELAGRLNEWIKLASRDSSLPDDIASRILLQVVQKEK